MSANVVRLPTESALASAWAEYERLLRELNDDILKQRGTVSERMAKAVELRRRHQAFLDMMGR